MKTDAMKTHRGFTLIEALVALVLLSIAAVALMTLQVRLRVAADEARHHDQALRLARNELERWRWQPDAPSPTLNWEGPDIGFSVAGSATLTDDAFGRADGDALDAGSVALPLRPVRLRVQWTDRTGQARSVTLDSLLPLNDPALSGWLQLPPGRAARLRAMQEVPSSAHPDPHPDAHPDTSSHAPTSRDDRWMAQAVRLAQDAVGLTDPNPRVGCVIVDGQDRVLGQGHTQAAGQAHAEVMALRDAQARGQDVRGATVYVTLEPCAHHGRTPPCCDALIAAGVGRVVVALGDPNPQVAGQGLARMRAAGIATEVLATDHPSAVEARELNIGFLTRMQHGRPFVRMKIAASLDGRTALSNGVSQWITGPEARRDGHAWRRRAGAVLTGIGTAREDDPRMDVRDVETVLQPQRVLIDSRLELSPAARLLAPPGQLLIYHALAEPGERGAALAAQGAELVSVADPVRGKVDLGAAIRDLGRRQINELHIEAGYKLNGSLLRSGLIDELLIYMAPMLLGEGRGMVDLGGLTALAGAPRFRMVDCRPVGGDLRLRLRPEHPEAASATPTPPTV
ncbi:riboflavin biosynthesis protein RibD [Roseateles noduli]|nr:riboflavin biosynthesis protein RibD [Roseateles noduli]